MRDSGRAQEQVSGQLSSGSRITRAADDAASLAISEKMRAGIRSIRQGARNANDGIAVVQTAEGALNEVSNSLIRLRELAIQASTGTYGDNERAYMQAESSQTSANVKAIIDQTKYNGVALFGGENSFRDVQVGIHNRESVDRVEFDLSESGGILNSLPMASIDLRTQSSAQNSLSSIDDALRTVAEVRSGLGASQNRLQSSADGAMISAENWSASYSRMRDADMAQVTSEQVRVEIQQQVGVAMLAQANSMNSVVLRLVS